MEKGDRQMVADRLETIKKYPDKKVDEIAKEATDEAYQQIDCLECANCCKTTVTTFTTRDVGRISKFLKISKKAFKRKYVFEDYDGNLTSLNVPCPFLKTDNRCQIYEVQPEACSSYPHTHKSPFNSQRYGHGANAMICPITFKVINDIESKLVK